MRYLDRFFFVFLAEFTLISCENNTTFDYLSSPNDVYVLEIEKHPGAAMVSTTMWVRIKRKDDRSAGSFDTIFKGRAGTYEKVYWENSEVIVIKYCSGYIHDIKTPFYDEKDRFLIHTQIINARGLTIEGKIMCPKIPDYS